MACTIAWRVATRWIGDHVRGRLAFCCSCCCRHFFLFVGVGLGSERLDLQSWARHATRAHGFGASEVAYEEDARVEYPSPLDAFRQLSGGWTQ